MTLDSLTVFDWRYGRGHRSLKLLFLFVLVLSMCPFGYAGIQDAENKK